MHEISYKRDLSALGQTVNINTLDNWVSKFEEYVEDLQAGVAELKDAAPLQFEEQHNLFLLEKQIVDTLVERVPISKNHDIKVEIRLDLFAILDQDAGLENLSPTSYSMQA